MKKASFVFALTLMGGIWLSAEASACGRRCKNVAPLGQPTCVRCVDDSTAVGDCVNRPAPCGCFFKACDGFAVAANEDEIALENLFSPDAEPKTCSAFATDFTWTAD